MKAISQQDQGDSTSTTRVSTSRAASAGQCGFTHHASGRICRLPHRHLGPCDPQHPPAEESASSATSAIHAHLPPLTTANGYSPTVIAPSKRRAMSTPIDAVRRPAASHLTPRRLTELGEELERQRCFRVLNSRTSQRQRRTSIIKRCGQTTDRACPHSGRAVRPVRHRRRAEPAPDRYLRKLRALPRQRSHSNTWRPLPMARLCMPCQYATETSR